MLLCTASCWVSHGLVSALSANQPPNTAPGFVNLTALRESFARAIPLRSDQFESIQRELSKIIEVQQAKGNNGIVKTKYLTFGIDADNIRAAKPRLERIETDILNNFKRLGVSAEVLNGQERLRVLHDILRMDTPEPFTFRWEDLPRSGLSTKDYIAPSSFLFNRAKDFRMGKKFASVSFLQILAPELSDRILKDFLDIESNIVVNIHVQSVDQVPAQGHRRACRRSPQAASPGNPGIRG